jgi:hypothetical protein
VNVGSASTPFMLFFTFDSGGIPGAPAFLTQGATGKDFADAGGTCEEFAGLGCPSQRATVARWMSP